MNLIKKNIPNALTCGNAICGLVGILLTSNKFLSLDTAVVIFYFILGALAFDFFDGFAARLLNAKSAIGKDLDSLADMVSFGVLPGLLLFRLLQYLITQNAYSYDYLNEYTPYLAFLIPIFSMLRLAKFNNDIRQNESFIGLPTPANTLLIIGIVLAALQPQSFLNPLITTETTLLIIFVLSYLLLAEIPLIALKFKSFDWKTNSYRYLVAIGSILVLLIFNLNGIPIIIILYLFLSLLQYIQEKVWQ